MKTDRVVLDTSVFVSLILSKRLNELVEWRKDFNTTIFVCPELVDELNAVLKRSK
jgi:predicted nucleic acid-binding protein